MSNERRPGHLWAIVQEWMDSISYPPSQRKLAARLDVSASAVSDWKYGDGFPEPDALRRLATELAVPYERVLDAVLKDRGYRAPDIRGVEEHVDRSATIKTPAADPADQSATVHDISAAEVETAQRAARLAASRGRRARKQQDTDAEASQDEGGAEGA